MTETMDNQVDLRQLAVDRSEPVAPSVPLRRHLWTRYIVPGGLIVGFLALVIWSAWDLVFPPQKVTVVPVFSTTAELRQAGSPLFQAAGWIEPRPTPVRVAALAPGVVAKLLVVEDQAVRAGEPVALLVEEDAQLAYRRELADLELRKADLTAAKATLQAAEVRHDQPVHLDASLSDAEASLARTETQISNIPFMIRRAEADYEAMRQDYRSKLKVQDIIASVDLDLAKAKQDSAFAALEGLQDRAESLEREREALLQRRDAIKTQRELLADEIRTKQVAASKVKVAAARVERARVSVAEAKLRLDRMTVRSPIDGRVFRLIAHPGARMGDSMMQMDGHDGRTIVTLYRPEMLQVRVDVRFEDIPKVLPGQPVVIENPALASALEGAVLFINSEADIQKNTLQVKVAIADPPPVFKPEMLVDVTFLAPQRATDATDADAADADAAHSAVQTEEVKLYVLPQLIHQDARGAYVWVADPSRRIARKTRVQTGGTGPSGLIAITAGLNSSSRVIASGTESLRDGARIRISGEAPGPGPPASAQEGQARPSINPVPTGADL